MLSIPLLFFFLLSSLWVMNSDIYSKNNKMFRPSMLDKNVIDDDGSMMMIILWKNNDPIMCVSKTACLKRLCPFFFYHICTFVTESFRWIFMVLTFSVHVEKLILHTIIYITYSYIIIHYLKTYIMLHKMVR